jgi:hypothetical protein
MNNEKPAARPGYAVVGPYHAGAYAYAPYHKFEPVERACPPVPLWWRGDARLFRCACGTWVTEHQLPLAQQAPCDGRPRCAICNTDFAVPHPNWCWAGVICAGCQRANPQAFVVLPPAGQKVG